MPPARRPQRLRGPRRGSAGALGAAFGRGVALLDRHTDGDHDRTVFTLAGAPGPLTRRARRRRRGGARDDRHGRATRGAHPAIGALDVCPVVWLDPGDRDAARTEAVAVADADRRPRRPGLPLRRAGARARARAERAYFRNGGLAELWLRMESGELRPDFGPDLPHPRGGATLVTARPPLAAFNVELDSGDVEVARAVAAGLRESGGGLPGVRAIGLLLSSGRAQVSTNVHDPLAVPLGDGGRAGARAGGAARRPAARGRAGRADPGRGAGRLPGRRADPRLRPGAARDRAAAGGA